MERVLLTGRGLLGYAIEQVCKEFSQYKMIFPERVFDLTHLKQAELMMEAYRPDIVIHNAAVVGGVKKNSENPETMYFNNIVMTANVIHSAKKFAKKIVGFGSGCAFDNNEKEIGVSNIHSGMPFDNNYAYGWAKRMTHINLKACLEEHKIPYLYIVFPALFGPNDNFDLENGHVMPSLIHKAKIFKELNVWGDGSQKRDLLFSYDAARAVISLLDKDVSEVVISSGNEVSVKEMAETIVKFVNPEIKIVFDKDKITGQIKRPKVNTDVFRRILPDFKFTSFEQSVKMTVDWFSNSLSIRGVSR